MKFSYHINGMHCAACIDNIKSALAGKVTVTNVTFNPPLLEIEADSEPSLNEINNLLAAKGPYRITVATHSTKENYRIRDYYPIFLIAIYIAGVAWINNFHAGKMDWSQWMNQFMAGFFLVFSAFKFLDLKGFAEGYANYDLLAYYYPLYGFVYPFFELGLGILYLSNRFPILTPWLTIIIMGFSSLGVINSLFKKQRFRCACLGTLLNVPLSSITLIEDLTMVALAALSLIMY